MALWMEKGSEPLTENEKADLEAIAAIKESSALELKVIITLTYSLFSKKAFDFILNNLFQEKGNQYVKMGKKHYSDAIDCYTRAIDQKALTDSETSVLFSNRAHVNLLLGNFRRALNDANDSIKLSPSNIKVHTLLWPCLDKQLIFRL